MKRVLLLLPTTGYRNNDFVAAARKLGVEIVLRPSQCFSNKCRLTTRRNPNHHILSPDSALIHRQRASSRVIFRALNASTQGRRPPGNDSLK